MSTNSSYGRRDFIKSATTGMAGILLSASLGAEEVQEHVISSPADGFIHRTLGNTGLQLPIISMGVMNSDNPNLVRSALDAGIAHLDTAWWYMSGRNEEIIGQVLQGRPRDSFVIATKVPGSVPLPYATGCFPDDEVSQNLLGSAFMQRFETSLSRLQLEYVDILYLHNVWTREAVLFEPLLKILTGLREEGRARFVGVSTHRNEPQVIQAAIDSEVYDVVLTAYNFRQEHRDEVRQAIAKAAQAGLGIIAMKVLAGGYLDEEKKTPVNAKAALKWVLNDENVHTTIPGFTTFDQLQVDLSVMEDLTLSEPEKKNLQLESSSRNQAPPDLYCQGCGSCLDQCVRGLPIPDIMRAYMYARSYGNYREAQKLVSSLNITKDPCSECEQCAVRCRKGFDVARRTKEVLPLRELSGHLLT